MATTATKIKNGTIRFLFWIWGIEMYAPEKPKDLPLNSLSPISDADSDGVFCDTLYWVLKNRKEKEIRNIAITGPYGSGKSSLLKTFREKHKNDSDLNFLNISLATFKEEKVEENVFNGGKPTAEDLLRLIELSILQQLFYFEKDKAIPDSRFKRIKSFNSFNIWSTAIILTVFVLALCQQINPCLITKILFQKCVWPVPGWLHYSTLLITCIFGFIILLKSIRVLRSITLKSFKLNDTAEFEISESINKSILNHHLDEILYFFQVTKYTVVIIEDLDRFEQTEIFTKLRELNLLINNSKKIKRDIVFIYAVRDELFRGEKERTKFFDFLIPIIPVINSSNSGEKLLSIVENSGYQIRKELIEDIALFIDDMRLLYNIMNEFYLYTKKLGSKLDSNKLLAMMVYKNLYPEDFVKLSNGTGELFKFFNEKDKLINQFIENKNLEIADKKVEIKQLEKLQIVDVSELRKLYIIQYISHLKGITEFLIDGNSFQMNQIQQIADDDELFDYFVQDKVRYTRLHRASEFYNYSPQTTEVTLKFEEIEMQVDSTSSYLNRIELINNFNENNTETLRKEIAKIEQQKIQIKNQPIKVLLQQQSISVELGNNKQQQLVHILLRGGYIDENYHDYISLFYEGSITKEDREFLLNVKAQIPTEHTYKLNKIANIIRKINTADFNQPYILNYDLVDYLFKTNSHPTQKKEIISLLSDESEASIMFLNGFIDISNNKRKLIKSLSEHWSNYWKCISKNTVLTQERIKLFLSLLLEHGELKSIVAISMQSDLKTYLEAQSDFFQLIDDQQKLFKVVEYLKLKFKQLDMESTEKDELKFVEQGGHHDLNPEIIRTIVQSVGNYDENTFNTKNYHAIQESECENLLEYINSNINDYITQVYLKISTNTDETEEYLLGLINDSDLNETNKGALLKFTKTKLSDISSVENLSDLKLLFTHSRLEPIWSNLIQYYHNNEDILIDDLIVFLNDNQNVQELSKTKIDNSEKTKPNLETVKKFIPDLLRENQIQDDLYFQLLKSIPWSYNRIPELETVDHDKMVSLIETKTLNLTEENYNVVRENYSNFLHIKLIRLHPTVFMKDSSIFELNPEELCFILKADEFTSLQKKVLLSTFDEQIILNNKELLKIIGLSVLTLNGYSDNDSVIKAILLNHILNLEDSLKFFNFMKHKLSKSETLEFLTKLTSPYNELGNTNKRPTLNDNSNNRDLLKYLKQIQLIKDYSITPRGLKVSNYRKFTV